MESPLKLIMRAFLSMSYEKNRSGCSGCLLYTSTAVAEMVEVWYYDTITGEKETHYAADIRI